MRTIQRCILILMSAFLLILSAFFNLDFSNRQALSINACYFGPYPPLFIVSGVSGTIFILSLCSFIKFKNSIIVSSSNGTIITLGFHWMINIYILLNFFKQDSVGVALLVSLLNCIICYAIIVLCERYFPAMLGNRTIKNAIK